jgi:hypothetical protein
MPCKNVSFFTAKDANMAYVIPMLAAEVVYPGELPEDPRELMRAIPAHRTDEARLVIDNDPEAILIMEAALNALNTIPHGQEKLDAAYVAGQYARIYHKGPEEAASLARDVYFGAATLDLAQVTIEHAQQ